MNQSQLQQAKEVLEEVEKTYLEERGWQYTCKTPGSYWLWEKRLEDGRTVIAEKEFALRIELFLEDV